jgi:hypothetical protein
MADGIGWKEQLDEIKNPEKRAAAIKASPVYRDTPLSKAEASHSWYEPVTATANFLNPTRVLTKSAPKTAALPNDFGREGLDRPAVTTAVTKEPEKAPEKAAVGVAERGIDRGGAPMAYTNRGPSPADAALAEYNRFMGKTDGGVGDAMVARGFMNKYQALKPLDQKQQELDDTRSFRERQMEHEKSMKEYEQRSTGSQARERLYSAQAGVAEGTAEREKQRNTLLMKMQDEKATPQERQAAQDYYMRFFGGKSTDAAERAAYINQGINPDTMKPLEFSTGGAVEAYADGGQIPAYGAAPQPQNPMLAQYGQYLGAAKQTGVDPVPFAQYINLLASTRAAPQETIGFADGGAIGWLKEQFSPKSAAGTLAGRGAVIDAAVGGSQAVSAPAPAAAAASAVAPADPSQNMWTLDPEREAEVKKLTGYATGGEIEDAEYTEAIPVAGKKLLGPGTGTSDSIPAIIDGQRPAALSSGEFVIPAHVVRAKGTEFFDKLLAQYADNKGQENG